MTKVKYSKTSHKNGNLIDKTINLDINVSFAQWCEKQIKHAETLALWCNGKTKIIQGKSSLYIQFIDMPNFNVIEKIFILA